MDMSINAHQKQGPTRTAWVWFEGSTALKEGQGVCYNWDYTGVGATLADGRRFNRVELPSTTNAQHFAGVTVRPYSAHTGGRLIEIYLPGSVCNVYAKANCTIGVGLLTFDVTSGYEGYFRYEGLDGEGSCIPFQTVDRSDTAGLVFAKLCEGPPSGGVEVVQLVDNTAWAAMVGGTTLIVGVACSTGSPTEEVLDGTIEGLRKKVEVITTAVTTHEAALDIENNDGITLAGGALASCALGAVGDQVVLKWSGGVWRNMASVGVTES